MNEVIENKWLEQMTERLNIRNIADFALFGSETIIPPESFLTCEKNAEAKLKQCLISVNCIEKEIFQAIDEYRTLIKESYFELGVVVGICMAAELLLKEDGI